MHGDRVAVRIEGPRFRGKPQGAIVEVLERRTKEVVGRLHVESGVAYLDARQPAHLAPRAGAAGRSSAGAESGQIVIVELTQQPGRERAARSGAVTRLIGDHGAPGMETEIAIHSHGLPCEFPAAVRWQRPRLRRAAFRRSAIAGREDLRGIELVTIDGEDARDFDDAVLLRAHARRLAGDRRDRRRRPLRAAGQRARRRGARARHVGVFPESRAADAARGAVERPVLADAGRGPAVPVLRAARRRRWPHHALALLRGRDALRGPAHLPRRRRVPRAARREARAEDSSSCASGCSRCTACTQRSCASAPGAARSSSTRPSSSSSSTSRAASPRWSSTRATTRIA